MDEGGGQVAKPIVTKNPLDIVASALRGDASLLRRLRESQQALVAFGVGPRELSEDYSAQPSGEEVEGSWYAAIFAPVMVGPHVMGKVHPFFKYATPLRIFALGGSATYIGKDLSVERILSRLDLFVRRNDPTSTEWERSYNNYLAEIIPQSYFYKEGWKPEDLVLGVIISPTKINRELLDFIAKQITTKHYEDIIVPALSAAATARVFDASEMLPESQKMLESVFPAYVPDSPRSHIKQAGPSVAGALLLRTQPGTGLTLPAPVAHLMHLSEEQSVFPWELPEHRLKVSVRDVLPFNEEWMRANFSRALNLALGVSDENLEVEEKPRLQQLKDYYNVETCYGMGAAISCMSQKVPIHRPEFDTPMLRMLFWFAQPEKGPRTAVVTGRAKEEGKLASLSIFPYVSRVVVQESVTGDKFFLDVLRMSRGGEAYGELPEAVRNAIEIETAYHLVRQGGIPISSLVPRAAAPEQTWGRSPRVEEVMEAFAPGASVISPFRVKVDVSKQFSPVIRPEAPESTPLVYGEDVDYPYQDAGWIHGVLMTASELAKLIHSAKAVHDAYVRSDSAAKLALSGELSPAALRLGYPEAYSAVLPSIGIYTVESFDPPEPPPPEVFSRLRDFMSKVLPPEARLRLAESLSGILGKRIMARQPSSGKAEEIFMVPMITALAGESNWTLHLEPESLASVSPERTTYAEKERKLWPSAHMRRPVTWEPIIPLNLWLVRKSVDWQRWGRHWKELRELLGQAYMHYGLPERPPHAVSLGVWDFPGSDFITQKRFALFQDLMQRAHESGLIPIAVVPSSRPKEPGFSVPEYLKPLTVVSPTSTSARLYAYEPERFWDIVSNSNFPIFPVGVVSPELMPKVLEKYTPRLFLESMYKHSKAMFLAEVFWGQNMAPASGGRNLPSMTRILGALAADWEHLQGEEKSLPGQLFRSLTGIEQGYASFAARTLFADVLHTLAAEGAHAVPVELPSPPYHKPLAATLYNIGRSLGLNWDYEDIRRWIDPEPSERILEGVGFRFDEAALPSKLLASKGSIPIERLAGHSRFMGKETLKTVHEEISQQLPPPWNIGISIVTGQREILPPPSGEGPSASGDWREVMVPYLGKSSIDVQGLLATIASKFSYGIASTPHTRVDLLDFLAVPRAQRQGIWIPTEISTSFQPARFSFTEPMLHPLVLKEVARQWGLEYSEQRHRDPNADPVQLPFGLSHELLSMYGGETVDARVSLLPLKVKLPPVGGFFVTVPKSITKYTPAEKLFLTEKERWTPLPSHLSSLKKFVLYYPGEGRETAEAIAEVLRPVVREAMEEGRISIESLPIPLPHGLGIYQINTPSGSLKDVILGKRLHSFGEIRKAIGSPVRASDILPKLPRGSFVSIFFGEPAQPVGGFTSYATNLLTAVQKEHPSASLIVVHPTKENRYGQPLFSMLRPLAPFTLSLVSSEQDVEHIVSSAREMVGSPLKVVGIVSGTPGEKFSVLTSLQKRVGEHYRQATPVLSAAFSALHLQDEALFFLLPSTLRMPTKLQPIYQGPSFALSPWSSRFLLTTYPKERSKPATIAEGVWGLSDFLSGLESGDTLEPVKGLGFPDQSESGEREIPPGTSGALPLTIANAILDSWKRIRLGTSSETFLRSGSEALAAYACTEASQSGRHISCLSGTRFIPLLVHPVSLYALQPSRLIPLDTVSSRSEVPSGFYMATGSGRKFVQVAPDKMDYTIRSNVWVSPLERVVMEDIYVQVDDPPGQTGWTEQARRRAGMEMAYDLYTRLGAVPMRAISTLEEALHSVLASGVRTPSSFAQELLPLLQSIMPLRIEGEGVFASRFADAKEKVQGTPAEAGLIAEFKRALGLALPFGDWREPSSTFLVQDSPAVVGIGLPSATTRISSAVTQALGQKEPTTSAVLYGFAPESLRVVMRQHQKEQWVRDLVRSWTASARSVGVTMQPAQWVFAPLHQNALLVGVFGLQDANSLPFRVWEQGRRHGRVAVSVP